VHREVRPAHEAAEHLAERSFFLMGPVDVEPRTGPMDRREERQALNVVPVDVRYERGSAEAAVSGLGRAELPQAGAEVEDDRVLAGDVERDASRVAPVATIRFG